MSSSSCENLPQELIIAIVDNLQDDKKSLSTFSLVCKAWTNPARHHIFSSLHICDLKDLEKIKAANIASTYAPFLRKLHLTSRDLDDNFWHEVIPFLADFSTPRLQSLALNDFAWYSLSPNERSVFLRRFQSIVSLWLRLYQQFTSNDVATIICSLPQLRDLLLLPSTYKSALSASSPLSPEFRFPDRLSTLHVCYFYHNYRSVLEWLGSSPEQLSINTLYLYLCRLLPQDLDTVNKFLKALGPSLEFFSCDSDEHHFINLTSNTNLRCLIFRFRKSSGDVSFAMSTLARIGSRQLEQVTFRLRDISWQDGEFSNTEWLTLDTILTGPQFAALRDVCISAYPSPSDLSALFATLLPKCHARGIISFVDQ